MVKKNTEMEVQKTRTSYLIREIRLPWKTVIRPAKYFYSKFRENRTKISDNEVILLLSETTLLKTSKFGHHYLLNFSMLK